MSGRITEASRRRMSVRERFVSMTPGPYYGIEERYGEKEPLLSITIEGSPDGIGQALAFRVQAAIEDAFAEDPDFTVTKRRTA